MAVKHPRIVPMWAALLSCVLAAGLLAGCGGSGGGGNSGGGERPGSAETEASAVGVGEKLVVMMWRGTLRWSQKDWR